MGWWQLRRTSDVEAAAWARELAAMHGAGVPVSQALKTLERHSPSAVLREASGRLYGMVMAGDPLSAAMERMPFAFPRVLSRLVAAGEASGALDAVLLRGAAYLEARASIRARTRAALVRPGITLGVLLLVGAVLVYAVLPAFESLYGAAGVPLPAITVAVMAAGRAVRRLVPLAGIALVASWVVLPYALGLDRTRRALWEAAFSLPVVGDILRRNVTAEAFRTVLGLYGAGIVLADALRIAAEGSECPQAREALLKARDLILRGVSLGDALRSCGSVFPGILVDMAAVGADSGRLGEMLDRACELLEQEADRGVRTLESFLEPAMTVAVGSVALIMALALYMPLFGLARVVR
jgi:type II secretory pathway component PulF